MITTEFHYVITTTRGPQFSGDLSEVHRVIYYVVSGTQQVVYTRLMAWQMSDWKLIQNLDLEM